MNRESRRVGHPPPLSTEYGKVFGQLEGALFEVQSGSPDAQAHARMAVDAFQSAKEKKDGLRPFPHLLQSEIESTRDELIKRHRALASGLKQQPVGVP